MKEMKLVLEDALNFKKCVDAISVLIEEAEFNLTEKGLFLKATDPSQISMIDFKLPKKAFKEFKSKANLKFGMDLNYLGQIMSRAKAKEELVLELDEKNSRLNITFSGPAKRKFSIPLIDIAGAELPSPKIDFDAEVKLKGELVQGFLKDAALISTHVILGVSPEGFFVKANSSKGQLKNQCQKKELTELNVKKECQAMYPLDYLQDMLKSALSQEEIQLQVKSNAPIRIAYAVGGAALTYFLAPRIET